MKLPKADEILNVYAAEIYFEVKGGKQAFYNTDELGDDEYTNKILKICTDAVKKAIETGELPHK